ncbi:MAG: GNAT family N-acetyltransferase [Thiotrichales bacterium]|nr:GNAT family N-acetyltransferase [Thiotrichales bacterium]
MSEVDRSRRHVDCMTASGKRMVLVTVNYLEMNSPDCRSAAPGWPERAVVRRAERPTLSFYRYLYNTVGADWEWYERRRLGNDALAAIVHDDAVEVHVLHVRGVPAGFVELDRRIEDEVEIAYFGLIPEYVGRGFGPALLGWALERAWSFTPRRVWLHTCSLDHPKALAVYLRAGFEAYDREVVSVQLELREPAGRGGRGEDMQNRSRPQP